MIEKKYICNICENILVDKDSGYRVLFTTNDDIRFKLVSLNCGQASETIICKKCLKCIRDMKNVS